MKNSHNNFILKYFDLLIKILLFFLLSYPLIAEENSIGSITDLNGTIVAITDELEERDVVIYDKIFLNEEIFITEGSSATIQFNDNTALIMKELTSINVSEFENSKKNPKFKAELLKGKIIIESGSIAKNNDGEMIVEVTTSSLGLRGTRIDVDLKPSGKSNISLATDSFGNVGEIELNTQGQTSNISSTEQVLEISDNNEINSRNKTVEEKNEAKSINDTLIRSSKIDEEEITKQLQKKLENGNLKDANNDGVIDEDDIKITTEQISVEKKNKIDFIVDNSKDENTEFLSDVINQSDEKNTGEVIEKIIVVKDNLVEDIVENLTDKDNKFLTSSSSEGADVIKEKIFETIVSKETDKSAEILSKVMAKSDESTISSVINNITGNSNEESKLSLKVMADFSEKSPEKLEIFTKNNIDQIKELTIAAVGGASSTQEDADLIAKVVSGVNDEISDVVISEVTKTSENENQNLSAIVLKSIVETNPDKIKTLSEENQRNIISKTLEAAKIQNENLKDTNIEEGQDLSNIIADIIMEADIETSGDLIQNLDTIELEENSDLNLLILEKISKKDFFEEKLEIISIRSNINSDAIKSLVVKSIKSLDEDKSLDKLTSMIEKSKGLISNIAIDSGEDSKENKDIIAKVVTKIIKKDPKKAIEILEQNKKTKNLTTIIKTKISKGEAITGDDFDDVFKKNLSPN